MKTNMISLYVVFLLAHVVSAQQSGSKIDFNLDFPAGTQFVQEGNTLHFTLPSNHYLIGVDNQGNFSRTDPSGGGTGGVTCTCNTGTGCSPVYSDGTYGCLMDGCSNCTKSAAIKRADGSIIEVEELIIADTDGSSSVTSFSSIQDKLILPHKFIDSEEVSSFLTELQQNFIESSTNQTKVVFVKHLGYVIPITVPSDIDDVSLRVLPVGDDDAALECRCNTNGSCPKKKKLIVTFCDAANCSSCTMSGRLINDQGEVKQFSVVNGRIRLQ
ncbi:MAG: hypothetical protein KF734_21455 [Saprospiraceae bacterium]|nr:hypothetical protein [Saprospiraceae bacterium]